MWFALRTGYFEPTTEWTTSDAGTGCEFNPRSMDDLKQLTVNSAVLNYPNVAVRGQVLEAVHFVSETCLPIG